MKSSNEKEFIVFNLQEQKTLGKFSFSKLNQKFIKTELWHENDLNLLDFILVGQFFNIGYKINKNEYDYSKIMVRRIL